MRRLLRTARANDDRYGQNRSNETHRSITDKHALLFRETKEPGWPVIWAKADDNNYDIVDLAVICRANRVTPHVAQNDGRPGGLAIDERTTR
jgi:hypothetical protein